MQKKNNYDKMNEFIASVFNVFQMFYKKCGKTNNQRNKMISLVIFNYVNYMAKQYDVDLKNISEKEKIDLIPIFEYISVNNIELYDFNSISEEDLDLTNKNDLERFVLTHVYYITRTK